MDRMKAAFFDVGDTLVEHWSPPEQLRAHALSALRREFGERPWYERLLRAEIEPDGDSDPLEQRTNRWYERWFAVAGIECDIETDRLRAAFAVPIDLVSTPVPGAFEAIRWCKAAGLRVVLVTNTLSRGDEEVMRDWRRQGLADAIDGVVSSHSVGWRKPHRAMFERALEIAGARPSEAFMVGDNLEADVAGAKRLGMRAVWRRVRDPQDEVLVTPDATVADLTELPGVVEPWLSRPRGRAPRTMPV